MQIISYNYLYLKKTPINKRKEVEGLKKGRGVNTGYDNKIHKGLRSALRASEFENTISIICIYTSHSFFTFRNKSLTAVVYTC